MTKAAEYHFTTESIMLSRNEMPTISGWFIKKIKYLLFIILNVKKIFIFVYFIL